jgi:hypothetical protein
VELRPKTIIIYRRGSIKINNYKKMPQVVSRNELSFKKSPNNRVSEAAFCNISMTTIAVPTITTTTIITITMVAVPEEEIFRVTALQTVGAATATTNTLVGCLVLTSLPI